MNQLLLVHRSCFSVQIMSEAVLLIRQALALRAKYRVGSDRVRVAPWHIGFHPANRNGEPPSGERCQSLLDAILGGGFDPGEADCNGVLVQAKPSGDTIHAFNAKACDGNPLLTPSVDGMDLTYGSLSHSHLNQVFKNILGRAYVKTDKITDPQGRLSMAMLEAHDPTFAKYCREGLLWDVLSWKLQEEEPEGLNIIQAAGNATHAAVMIPHETEAIASLSRLCTASAVVSARLNFERAREKLQFTLPLIADDPDFLCMFRFVVDLGGDVAPFVPDLRQFTHRFVNPQVLGLVKIALTATTNAYNYLT